MARSGWKRGLVFYAIDLVGFTASVLAAVRFHEIPAIFYGLFWSPRTAAFVGGLTIFVPLIILVAIVGSKASRAMYRPGLFTLNRVAGVVFAGALALVVLVVGVLFIRSAPLPFGLGRIVGNSSIATVVVDAATPAIEFFDREMGLDLCGGKLRRVIRDACRPVR